MAEDNSHTLQLQSLNNEMEIEMPRTTTPNSTSQQVTITCSQNPKPKVWKRSSSRLGRLQRQGSNTLSKEDSSSRHNISSHSNEHVLALAGEQFFLLLTNSVKSLLLSDTISFLDAI
ncbi:AraC family transcriptional regulator [Striga asiatica]|uniref:AraC family transcriptional regulator n=1 Tax=Striga asiatica TaxID=4170 RepID=A0A5A7P2Z5_STRAF|nr:AraC family transcriptional regulator [Striga asiatica]